MKVDWAWLGTVLSKGSHHGTPKASYHRFKEIHWVPSDKHQNRSSPLWDSSAYRSLKIEQFFHDVTDCVYNFLVSKFTMWSCFIHLYNLYMLNLDDPWDMAPWSPMSLRWAVVPAPTWRKGTTYMLAQATQKWGRPWHSPRQFLPLISFPFNPIDYCMDTPLNLSSVWCLSENQSSSQAVYDNISEALQCQVTKWYSARVCPSAELFNHRQPSALGQAAGSQIIKHPCVKHAINILYIISVMVNNDKYVLHLNQYIYIFFSLSLSLSIANIHI